MLLANSALMRASPEREDEPVNVDKFRHVAVLTHIMQHKKAHCGPKIAVLRLEAVCVKAWATDIHRRPTFSTGSIWEVAVKGARMTSNQNVS